MQSIDTIEELLSQASSRLVYPGIAGEHADIGMRHSIRDLTVPLWSNRAWRDAFKRGGEGEATMSVLEYLGVKAGIDFCEFLQLILVNSRRSSSERRPLTIDLDFRILASRDNVDSNTTTTTTSFPVKLVGHIVHAQDSTVVTKDSFVFITFSSTVEMPSYALCPPLRPPSLARGAHRPPTPRREDSDPHRTPSGRFGMHQGGQQKPLTPGETIGEGWILEGSTRPTGDGRPKKKQRTGSNLGGKGKTLSPLVTNPVSGSAPSAPRNTPSPATARAHNSFAGGVPEEDEDRMDVEGVEIVVDMDEQEPDDDLEGNDDEDATPLGDPKTDPFLSGIALDTLSTFQKRLLHSEMGRAILRFPCARLQFPCEV